MNDLVRPTALFGGARVPAVGPSGILGTVPNPPPQVSQLSVGTTLTGVVVGHDAGGHTLVRTDLGTLSVATKAQLPVNSEVTLHIRSNGGQLHVLIMHSQLPHGAKDAPAPQPLQPAGAQAGGAGPQSQATTGPAGHAPTGHGPASDLLTLGQHLRAVVQSPAAAPNAAAGGAIAVGGAVGGAGQPPAGPTLATLAAQLAPGSELQLRIISVQAPAAQAAGGQAAGNPAPGGPASAAPTPGPRDPTTPGATTPRATTPGATTPGATTPGVPGGVPGLAGRIAAYGALQGGAGQAGSPTAAGATPNQPNPAATTPQAAAVAAPTGQGAAPGAPAPASPAGAQAAPAPNSQPTGAAVPGTPAAAAVTPTSGAPASGVIASYAAVGGAPQGPGPGSANPTAVLAARGVGQGSGQGGRPVAPAQAAQPGAPGANITVGPGGGPAAAPASAPAMPGPASGAIQFTGTVTAVTHAGQPVLQTPLGTLTLEIRAPLQTGSRITFELPAGALTPSGPGAAGPGPAALGTLAHSWPALEETLRVLQEIAPGVAAATLRDAVPQPGSRLASGLLFFLAALSGGDVTRWLGNQASQALKSAGRDSLLSRLGQDFGQLSRLADNQGGDWRLFFIPLHDGDQLRQLRLFLRHGGQHRDGDARDDEDQTRFVVEVEMSRLGDLQLDGLVREKRLDLILRSRAPLPDFMRRDIMKIFHETNQITGNRGNMGFQSSLEWKAMPIEAPEVAVDAGVVV